jgi:carbon storage regulator
VSLVISRKPGERFMIGENIIVEIVAIHGSQVRIAIDAPKEIPIVREELTEGWAEGKR